MAIVELVVHGISAASWWFAPMLKLAFAVVFAGSFTIASQLTVSTLFDGAIAIRPNAGPLPFVYPLGS